MKYFISILSILGALCGQLSAAAAKTPNVIFILTDDQGWNDAHFAGHPYVKTPNLDKFAAQSTWFRQFYVASTVCSPSRAAFMTAHFPARHEVHGHFASDADNKARSMPNWLDDTVTTLPDLLKGAGYATAHIGKWHLGSGAKAPQPKEYGIDFARIVTGNGPALGTDGSVLSSAASGVPEHEDPYFRAKSSKVIVDQTIEFIRAHKDGPFYANVWTMLPHAPLKPTPEQLAEYESLAPHADDPAFGPWMQKYLGKARNLKSQMQVFCASLTDLDTQLGRLFAALDEMKLADNTLIFFSSDNGAEDYRIGIAANAGVGNTGPLRARKRSMYEGGIRTFGLLRWPGHVAAGKVDETTVLSAVDFLPTICKLAGVNVPATLKPDGEDMSDVWLGASRPRSTALFWEWLFTLAGKSDTSDGYTPPPLAVREGIWKLFVNHDGSHAQLYQLPQDIGEDHDVAAAHPDIVKALAAKAVAWSQTLPPSKLRQDFITTGKPSEEEKPSKQKKNAQKAATQPAPKNVETDRAAIFKQKDTNNDGQLSLEEFLKGFTDIEGAKKRFTARDKDKNGALSREEFIKEIIP